MMIIFGSFFLMGLILTLALAFSAKRLETLSFLTPNQAGLSSSIIVAVGSVVLSAKQTFVSSAANDRCEPKAAIRCAA